MGLGHTGALALFDKLADGVIVLDPSGRPIYANPIVRSWLGLAPDGPLGNDASGWFASADAWHAMLQRQVPTQLIIDCSDAGECRQPCQALALNGHVTLEDEHTIVLLQPLSEEQQGLPIDPAKDLNPRIQALASLVKSSTAINQSLDAPTIAKAAAREAVAWLDVDASGLLFFERQSDLGHTLATFPPTDQLTPPISTSANAAVAQVLSSGQALSISDTQDHPLGAAARELLPLSEALSILLSPLRAGGRVIGVLSLGGGQRTRPFSDNEIELAQSFADQSAISLENARLYAEAQRSTRQLEQRVQERTQALELERNRVSTLLQITSELSTSLDLGRVLHRALQLVGDAVGADQGSIFTVDRITRALIYRAALGRPEPLPSDHECLPFGANEGLVGWVIQNQQSAIVNDTLTDNRWAVRPDLNHSHRSVIAVPLLTGAEIWGVLMMFSNRPHVFTESHLQLVEAAALQISPTIYNAELYDLIRDQAEQLGGMLRVDREEAAKNAAILESVADGVMVVDAIGKVILFNAAAEHILELERSHILGEPISQFIGMWGKAGAAWGAAIAEWTQLSGLEPNRQFLEEQLELGNKIVSVHLAPVLSGSGYLDFLGTVSVFRDITRDVELDRMQREWVSTVSHELRTPMTSIKGYADLLILGAAGEMSEGQRRFLEIIKNNADRLSFLVNDLLDISRIETGRMRLDITSLDLHEVISTVVTNLLGRREQEEKRITIKADLSADLPPVAGDVDRVTQVLTNLMDNAFNYTPDGGNITVLAQSLVQNRLVRIQVTDTGIGISAEDQARIFDRFFRSEDPEVQKISGTGLGLAIVHHLVEMHGGRLRVFSEGVGKGSTFSFTLPIAGE